MRIQESRCSRIMRTAAFGAVLTLAGAVSVSADEVREAFARVDIALKENPNHVPRHALYACQDRRVLAAKLYTQGREERAKRALKYCFNLLGIPEMVPASNQAPVDDTKLSAQAAENAAREFAEALTLTPNIADGLEIYRGCAACHTPEGWGLTSGVVPQLAGQHRRVVIKQLADIRAGNRENRMMVPYSSVEAIGGAQAVADVAAYIDTLEISIENGRGEGGDLVLGERLYQKNCARCHLPQGEGNNETDVPRIQAQHYDYLVSQFELIRNGKRQNANPEMVAQIKDFKAQEMRAVLDYVSRLEPPVELQAPPGWRNPDFTQPPVAGN